MNTMSVTEANFWCSNAEGLEPTVAALCKYSKAGEDSPHSGGLAT